MDDSSREIERFKAQLQVEVKKFEADLAAKQATWQETAIRDRERWLHELRTMQTMFRALVDFALITIRSLVLVNGAAIVGIITFTGNMWSKRSPSAEHLAKSIAPAIGYFATGLVLALLTAGFAYIAQVVYVELKRPQPALHVGNWIRAAAILFAVLSLVAFIVGAYASVAVFGSPPPT